MSVKEVVSIKYLKEVFLYWIYVVIYIFSNYVRPLNAKDLVTDLRVIEART